jgi:hypothetical protein
LKALAGFDMISITPEITVTAARLRASPGLRLLDGA